MVLYNVILQRLKMIGFHGVMIQKLQKIGMLTGGPASLLNFMKMNKKKSLEPFDHI